MEMAEYIERSAALSSPLRAVGISLLKNTARIAGPRWTEVLTMTLTEMFTICDSCAYAPCLCGNDPENCVAYVMRTSDNG